MKQSVRLIVLEHLGYQLDVHILDVDLLLSISVRLVPVDKLYLKVLVHNHDCLIQFLNICDDSRKQQALLLLVWALLLQS